MRAFIQCRVSTNELEPINPNVFNAYIGCYGLESHLYAKFLLTRWAQITNSIDEYFYI